MTAKVWRREITDHEMIRDLTALFAIHRMLSKETWGVLNNLLRRTLSGTDTKANRVRELRYAGASDEFIEWFTTHEGESTDGR